ncbi:hypothetical protein [Actinoplanes sp. NPDC051859]|uniref:hypothetical protein n=1 Tax=Actinoplanes sp. NPDC051859 TaxID=3363909 RepID=UPI00378B941D
MTAPNDDDLRTIAEPGGPDPDSAGDLSYDEIHEEDERRDVPAEKNSPEPPAER